MTSFRTLLVIAATGTFGLLGCAQAPVDPMANRAGMAAPGAGAAMPMPAADAGMARMDPQMKAMRGMHEKMMAAKTPEVRNALMAEHMKVMQDSMAMMSGTGPGGMAGMGDMKGMGPMGADMAAHHKMMEKHMEMMHTMMQMMTDRMAAMPGKQ